MPSEKGPYVVLPLFDTFFVEDKDGIPVNDFKNGKPKIMDFATTVIAGVVASNLTTDDTQYRAMVKAHYLGGLVNVSTQSITELMQIIAALEVASFASDPVAVSVIARLLAVVVAL